MNLATGFRSTLLVGLLLGISPGVTSALAGPLDGYRWKHRLILVDLPAGASPQALAATLKSNRDGLDERDVRVVVLSEAAKAGLTADRPGPEATLQLRKQYRLTGDRRDPVFILIGKDGGEKSRQNGTLNLKQWFQLIDAMPMRRDEAKGEQKK